MNGSLYGYRIATAIAADDFASVVGAAAVVAALLKHGVYIKIKSELNVCACAFVHERSQSTSQSYQAVEMKSLSLVL